MKILDRKTFLAMPDGTIYAKISTPIVVDGGLSIKDSMRGENDWWVNDLTSWESRNTGEWSGRFYDMHETGASYPIEQAVRCDGMFEEGDLFLIYERADLEWIRSQIDEALSPAPQED